MDEVDFTIPHHAIGRGLDYVELEVRQDLLADAPARRRSPTPGRVLPAALGDVG
jgi:predicted N-formylglutamate amidohydrolase